MTKWECTGQRTTENGGLILEFDVMGSGLEYKEVEFSPNEVAALKKEGVRLCDLIAKYEESEWLAHYFR